MILLHAYAQTLRNGMPNPKNYPHWPELLKLLPEKDVVQIAVAGEPGLVADLRVGLPLREIRALVERSDYWLAVDSFLPHLAHHVAKPGVVLWSVSDPTRFGYAENLNLLRDRKFLRAHQYRVWEEQSFVTDAFVSAMEAALEIRAWLPALKCCA